MEVWKRERMRNEEGPTARRVPSVALTETRCRYSHPCTRVPKTSIAEQPVRSWQSSLFRLFALRSDLA